MQISQKSGDYSSLNSHNVRRNSLFSKLHTYITVHQSTGLFYTAQE